MLWDLYGLKSPGSGFRNHLSDCIHHLGFLPCPADLDIWMKPMVRREYGFYYYVYVLIYVDDVMVIHHDADSVLWRTASIFS